MISLEMDEVKIMYTTTEMDWEKALEIIDGKYSLPYHVYNLDRDGLMELLSGAYRAVIDESQSLVGYYCTGKYAQVPNQANFQGKFHFP